MKLTDAQVGEVREAARLGRKQSDIAAQYGISHTSVSMMVHGNTRAKAPGPVIRRRHRAKDASTTLTDHQIVTARLRAAAGETITHLAAEYGISITRMSGFTTGRDAPQLPGPRTQKRAKLKSVDIEYIRQTYADGIYTSLELSDMFEVSQGNINRITSGTSWRRAPGPITRKAT